MDGSTKHWHKRCLFVSCCYTQTVIFQYRYSYLTPKPSFFLACAILNCSGHSYDSALILLCETVHLEVIILSAECSFPVVVIWQPFHMKIIREISHHVECFLLTEWERSLPGPLSVLDLWFLIGTLNKHTLFILHFYSRHLFPLSASLPPPSRSHTTHTHKNQRLQTEADVFH